jgi:hypothetical protein
VLQVVSFAVVTARYSYNQGARFHFHSQHQKIKSLDMATSASTASPPSPSRALHSGVSVLEHLGDAEEMNNNNDNTIGTAGILASQ